MPGRMERYAYVDTLRGIAILMVILVHSSQMVSGANSITIWLSQYGQMGVQLFFVASAHTLCLSFSRREHEPWRLLSFYIRRIFRIAPLYYSGIATYFIIYIVKRAYQGSGSELISPYTLTNVLSNVFLINGLVPAANNNIVPGGWSIGTEVLFYLIFPPLFLCCNRIFKVAKMSGLFALIAFTMAVNVVFQSARPGFENNSFFYFSIINQLPVFLIGMLSFYVVSTGKGAVESSQAVSAIGFMVFTAVTLFLRREDNNLLFAVIPSTAGVSFLFLLLWVKRRNNTLDILRQTGKLSYSMYIFHFIFAWYIVPRVVSRLDGSLPPGALVIISFLATVAFSLVAASASERLIERSGISAGSKLVARLKGRATTISAMR